jgi:hypothetical protein
VNSAHPLLVLSSREPAKKSQHDFRQAVNARGGVWLTRESTVGGVAQQVRDYAPGSFVLFLGIADHPFAETVDVLNESCEANPLADVIYADKEDATRRKAGNSERLHFPDWSPHRIAYEQFVGDTFLVRVAALLSIAATLDVESPWDNGAFLHKSADLDVCVAHVDDVWVKHERRPESAHGETAPVPALGPRGSGELSETPSFSQRCSLITLTAGSPREGEHSTPVFNEHLAAIRGSGANVAEHIVVIGDECNASLRNTLVNDPTLHVVSDTAPFNFARRSNRGSQAASGEILVFVNDDFVPIRSDWLELLTAPLADERVAITGGTLLFEDNSVQHLGVGIIAGSDRHFYSGTNMSIPRVASLVAMNREVDAVTGACLAVRADVFNDVGGLFEGFPLNYNDIDLCLKVRLLGRSVVHVGAPLGHHFESVTREAVMLPEEASLFFARWPTRPLESRFPFECFG